MVVGAIDQDAAHAHVAHPAEGDLDWAVCGSRGGQAWACPDQSGAQTGWQIIDSWGIEAASSYCVSWVWIDRGRQL